jgi:hypothetical protein
MRNLRTLGVCLLILTVMVLTSKADVQAQEDNAMILSRIANAYEISAAASSYTVELQDELEQEVILTLGDDTITLNLQLENDYEGTVQGESLAAVLDYTVEQSQVVGDGEPVEGEVELGVEVRQVDGQTYLNFDETPEEFRGETPSGWQVVGEGIVVPMQADLSADELVDLIGQVRLESDSLTALFNEDIVTDIELLGEDEHDDVSTEGFMLTLDLEAALSAQETDASALFGNLAPEIAERLIGSATYTFEVWMGIDDGLVREHELVIEIADSFEAGTLEGDLSEASLSATITLNQSLELSGFDAGYDIAVPEVGPGDEGNAE